MISAQISLAAFRRAWCRLWVSVVVLSGAVMTYIINSSIDTPVIAPQTLQYYDLSQSRWLRRYQQWAEQYQWHQPQVVYAETLNQIRQDSGISKLSFQVYPDRYGWMFGDRPDHLTGDGIQVNFQLKHGQQFITWLHHLQNNALAFPLQCRINRPNQTYASDHSWSNFAAQPGPQTFNDHPVSINDSSQASGVEQLNAECELIWFTVTRPSD